MPSPCALPAPCPTTRSTRSAGNQLLHTSLRGITAAEPVAGIVLGMVCFGDSIRVSLGLILPGASG